MKKDLDFNLISKIILLTVIFSTVVIVFFSVGKLDSSNSSKEEENIKKIITKALVQCYALEGNYPASIEYLVKYGIVFNNEKYLYHYEPFGESIPTVILVRID